MKLFDFVTEVQSRALRNEGRGVCIIWKEGFVTVPVLKAGTQFGVNGKL
jgi:hypothetical protein